MYKSLPLSVSKIKKYCNTSKPDWYYLNETKIKCILLDSGLENFCVDMEFMTGMVVTKYWRWCWGLITPFIMIVVFLYAFISLQRTTYGDYVLPMKAYGK